MPTCLDGHIRFQDGCPSCEAGNFRSEHDRTTIVVPHGFVATRDDPHSCNICSGVIGDPIHLIRNYSSNQGTQVSSRERESERQQAPQKTYGRGAGKSILLAVAVIVGAVLAVGYFLSDSGNEEKPVSNIPIKPVDPDGPISAISNTDSPLRGSPKWIAALEFAVHQLVNFERQKNSLSVLGQDAKLADIARSHSEDMVLNNYFEHENIRGQTAADRGNAVGYRCLKDFGSFYTEGISENIFQGWYYSSFNARGRNYMPLEVLAFEIVQDWMNSPGHRENILTEIYDREGIGVGIGPDESVWVTQNFC